MPSTQPKSDAPLSDLRPPDLRPSDAPLADVVAAVIEGRALLSHPFYQRWVAGTLALGELAEYAVQYRAFEEVLPAVLTAVAGRLEADGEVEAGAMVERNLSDELGRPEAHLSLFDRFAEALPDVATTSDLTTATVALVDTYRTLAAVGPVAALAGLAAYETQAPGIASTKSEGLRRWYGMDASGTEFWDVHATMDAEHGDWALEALFMLGADTAEVASSASLAANAWWAFLDEREAQAPAQ